ncbi:RNA polymerase sigma-70 factor (ECF subfamily) [Saccharopolyspora erythraea NRRL 2338]|uniref:RNA polymerase sigma factor n=2 Tax=Saccharopolyspora erythraea TaxID=1836 RepID=A4FB20_SACEN|nr:sigma-70 family RNA polymerase sigma factor [Saccharopolyspora erythraea]PFG95027.1 RNA polymerase sigma-70 factor (ECF subfamily) [Saccharopolyspora erythraea NRRL 2338]QRK91716.1 sigma-70 family RNA polymerase sigma factor [Saccharopolyspora erythraea]CAM01245.1 putative RNA polymerase sigma factor [Saccharopolyspora erythraea NRRL 2338]
MDENEFLADRFEAHRAHLRAVAYRMLGSHAEAEDAVQEAWLRLSRSDTSEVANLGGWLTTVVGRVCLDVLRSRKSRREDPRGVHLPDEVAGGRDPATPEQQAVLADSVGQALLVVLDTLEPAERLAFVLHDMFAVPYDEIAPVVGRSTAAARQLASRARRRVQGTSPAGGAGTTEGDAARRREVVDAFLTAARGGDLDALLAVLDPDVVLRADPAAVETAGASRAHGAPLLAGEIRGASAVADTFSGRARGAQPALVDGVLAATYAPGGTPRVVFGFAVEDGRIVGIDVIADPARLAELDVEPLEP